MVKKITDRKKRRGKSLTLGKVLPGNKDRKQREKKKKKCLSGEKRGQFVRAGKPLGRDRRKKGEPWLLQKSHHGPGGKEKRKRK